MKPVEISVAYMPLVDAAPLIIAQEMGFAQSEGIALNLIAAPSWSSVRDMLAFGRVDAAHLLSPVPLATAMGLGGVTTQISAVSVLSVNGNVIGVGDALEAKLRDAGFAFDFSDPVAASAALAEVSDRPLTFGVPFPFSMHVALLRYWAKGTTLGRDGIRIRTVPPPLMANALAAGDVDAFCVGEPWGSVAVENGAGALILPGHAIWSFAPEKVLSVTQHIEASGRCVGINAPGFSIRAIEIVEPNGQPVALGVGRIVIDLERTDRALIVIKHTRVGHRTPPSTQQLGSNAVPATWRDTVSR